MINIKNPTPAQRDNIAKMVCAEIRESEREKERLRERWIFLRAIHDCEENTSQVQLIEGVKPYMLPLSRAKGDRIVGAVVDGITGMSPYVQVEDPGKVNDDLDMVESDIMVLAQDAGDVEALKTGAEDAFITNSGVWRIRPIIDERVYDSPTTEGSGERVTRIDWEAIDPIDVCCYPPYFGTFDGAKTVGHRWSELLYRIKQDMRGKNARYFDVPDLLGGDDPMRGHRGRDEQNEEYAPQDKTDAFVELWEVVSDVLVSEGDETPTYKKCLCVVALTNQKLLSIQDYPYSKPWYVAVRMDYQRKRIFPNTSPAQRLQGLQLAYSDAFTAMIQATYGSLGPIVLMSGGQLSSKVTKLKPFMMLSVAQDVKIQTIQASPQIGGLGPAMEKVEEVTDSLTGIGRNGTGQQMPASTTATEIDAIQSAQSAAEDQYTQIIASSVALAMGMFVEYYKVHYDDLKAAYKDRLRSPKELIQTLNPTLSVNGVNGVATSTLSIKKMQMLLGMVMEARAAGIQTEFDPAKIIMQIAEALGLPFSLERLETDDGGLTQLLMNPAVQELLKNGEPLPQIMAEIQARTNGQQPGQGPNGDNGQPPQGGPGLQPPGGVPTQPVLPGVPGGNQVTPPGVAAPMLNVGAPA